MPIPEKTYQSILRNLSRVSVEALPQIDMYLQNLVGENKAAKKKAVPALKLPTNQSVTDEEVLSLWADRKESAQEMARQIRQRNRRAND
jgi:hypothetical protein